jgi:hypothetical protein
MRHVVSDLAADEQASLDAIEIRGDDCAQVEPLANELEQHATTAATNTLASSTR